MRGEFFFDTNVLVYAFDKTQPKKRKACKKLVESVFKGKRRGVISNQVLAELFHVLTRKVKFPLKVKRARAIVDAFARSENWRKITYDEKAVCRAMELVERYKLQFWDALIAATMLEHGISFIYTENVKDFGKLPWIKAINPMRKE